VAMRTAPRAIEQSELPLATKKASKLPEETARVAVARRPTTSSGRVRPYTAGAISERRPRPHEGPTLPPAASYGRQSQHLRTVDLIIRWRVKR
jgi:hypothetical protein